MAVDILLALQDLNFLVDFDHLKQSLKS